MLPNLLARSAAIEVTLGVEKLGEMYGNKKNAAQQQNYIESENVYDETLSPNEKVWTRYLKKGGIGGAFMETWTLLLCFYVRKNIKEVWK